VNGKNKLLRHARGYRRVFVQCGWNYCGAAAVRHLSQDAASKTISRRRLPDLGPAGQDRGIL